MSKEGYSIRIEDFEVEEFRENCGVYIGVVASDLVEIVRTHRVDRRKSWLKRRNGYKYRGNYIGYMYDVWEVERNVNSNGIYWGINGTSVKEFARDMLNKNIEHDIKKMEKLREHEV